MSQDFEVVDSTVEESAIQPLVSAVSSSPTPVALQTQGQWRIGRLIEICKDSRLKAISLILMWNVIIGITYGMLQCVAVGVALGKGRSHKLSNSSSSLYQVVLILCVVAIGQMILFPFSGLLADLKFGRYKVVTFSQVLITLAFILVMVAGVLELVSHNLLDHISKVIYSLSSILVFVGFSGFQSNSVQFGLDQLLDAPSKHLSMFLCLYVWTSSAGELFVRVLGTIILCDSKVYKLVGVFSIILGTYTSLLLLCGCCKHSWFYCETKTYNPYQKIYKVLKFVAKNKYPLRRSAMTYCDDIVPSRMDYAKLLYGGPFTTEVVEDVKTFLRMLLMLFLVSPVFYYTVPGAYIFPLYGLHMGKDELFKKHSHYCSTEWVILQSGNLAYIVTFIGFPVYIFLFQHILRKWLVLILQRLILGIVLMVAFMWVMTLLYAAAIGWAEHRNLNTSCLFTSAYMDSTNLYTLDFPVYYLILPNVLAGIGLPIINVAMLEFVSAQSPHTMKGLLLGIFYNFRGLYALLGCLFILPFTSTPFNHIQISPFLECGFWYYIFNALLGVVFIVVAKGAYKWYQYRQRDDKPYDHRYVEDYYRKYANKDLEQSACDGEEGGSLRDGTRTYGTIR